MARDLVEEIAMASDNGKCGDQSSGEVEEQLSPRRPSATCMHKFRLYKTQSAGIVESLDPIVKEFLAASDEEKKSALSKLEEEIEKLSGSAARHGQIYSKVAKSYMTKGSDYVTKEIARLERVLEKSISEAKTDELTLKKNIISAFAA